MEVLHFNVLCRYAGTLTLLVIYGYRVTSNDDPFLNLAEECVDLLSNDITSGGGIWPVDIFPFRKSPTPIRLAASSHICASQIPPFVVPWRRVQAQGDTVEDKDGGVRRQAIRARQVSHGMSEFNLSYDVRLIAIQREGTATPCFCTTLLDEMLDKDEKHAEQDFDLRWTANSMYSGRPTIGLPPSPALTAVSS